MGLLYALLARLGWMGNGPWWRSEQFWLALAALVLPFGWVLFLMPLNLIRERLQPVRSRVRTFNHH